MAKPSDHRLEWIDVAKGLGIALVVYGHVFRGLEAAGIISASDAMTVIDSVIYSFHMPLFFFLAGIFLDETINRRGMGGAIWSKVETVLYPYVVWSLLQGAIEVALAQYTNGGATIGEVLSLLWQPRAQFWFLYALFQIFAVSAIIFSKSPRWGTYAFAGAGILLFWFGSGEALGSFVHASRMLIFFILGVLFYRNGGLHVEWTVLRAASVVALFVIAELLFHIVLGLRYTDRSPASLLVACCGIAAVIGFSNVAANGLAALLSYLGRMSMYVYLMHILAASGARVVLAKLWPDASVLTHITLGVLAGLVLPLAAARLCERFSLMFLFRMPRISSRQAG